MVKRVSTLSSIAAAAMVVVAPAAQASEAKPLLSISARGDVPPGKCLLSDGYPRMSITCETSAKDGLPVGSTETTTLVEGCSFNEAKQIVVCKVGDKVATVPALNYGAYVMKPSALPR